MHRTETENAWSAVTLLVCLLLAALCLLLASVARAEAQTQVPSPTPASTRILWDHDGANTDRYLLIVDGGRRWTSASRRRWGRRTRRRSRRWRLGRTSW